MFKVICIDAQKKKNSYSAPTELRENEIYEVEKELLSNKGNRMYWLVGFYFYTNFGDRIGYAVERFIPLSEIDEMEIINESVLAKV